MNNIYAIKNNHHGINKCMSETEISSYIFLSNYSIMYISTMEIILFTLSFFSSNFGVEWIAGNRDHRKSKQINSHSQKKWKQINIHISYINMTYHLSISVQKTLKWYKKAQLTQGLRVTAVHVRRPLGKNLSSAGNTTLEPNITSIGKPVLKLWPFLDIQDGRQPTSWIFGIRKLHYQIGQPREPYPRTKYPVSMLYTAGNMLV